ncbi:hypothetical protein OPV22_022272 [Ensete ventricosum]|uniref:FHA domain-containing protein n=1 Tax=Ensete ventricosum TaxID=4639 RepID=A0AAV8QKV3_ENSVE|nr:hypothetical protein OPV22_022272 [Ensete ventricosum]
MMADKDRSKSEEKEIKIAVLSVLKKGSILKRLFLNFPPPHPTTAGDGGHIPNPGGGEVDDEDHPILFGRHPDCHVVVDHPSISRFHLAARLVPSLQKLAVTDLSSVHGTWVSGTKIPPNVAVDMVDGDILSLGASTRVYRIQWVSSSRALEMDNPLEPLVEDKVEVSQDDCEELLIDMNEMWPTVIPSAPPLPESMNPSPLPATREQQNPILEAESSSRFAAFPILESVVSSMPTMDENSSPQVLCAVQQPFEGEHLSLERSEKGSFPSSLLSRRSKSRSVGFLRIETGRGKEKTTNTRPDVEVGGSTGKENNSVCDRAKREEKLCRVLFENGGKGQDREEQFDSDKENVTPMSGRKIKRISRVLQKSGCVADHSNVAEENCKHEVLSDLRARKASSENLVVKSNTCAGKSKKYQEDLQMPHSNSITNASVLEEDVLYGDKENWTPDSCKHMKSRKVSGGILMKVEDNENTFPSDKENLTPDISPSAKSKESSFSSCARIEKEIVKRRVERIPFQPLLEISASKSCDSTWEGNCASTKDALTSKCEPSRSSLQKQPMGEVIPKAEERKIWSIVVDANCFLDEESRRSLQLLEGLKGTHLIVPRIVIRELDCLKRRESLFSKSTKMASKALQWIEECMVNTSWWIHVQSSSETLPVVPTPPASPRSPFGDGIDSKSFSAHGSLTEIVSPTAEDHILDCALLFDKTKNDGQQFILLSNSITLKIKAMAEGLLCETPKEFRANLVNPFSNRFLWGSSSSPRGSTWRCSSSDVGLLHNPLLLRQPVRTVGTAAEAAKGLKLILMHNSQYGLSK